MDCSYELVLGNNIFSFNSDRELAKFILDNNIKADEVGAKFSLDLTAKQRKVFEAITSTHSENKFKNNKGLYPTEFLKQKFDLGKGAAYLAPFFDQENYVKNAAEEEVQVCPQR